MLGSDTAFMKLELVSAIEFGSEIPGWNDDDVNCEFIDPGSDVPGKKLLLEADSEQEPEWERKAIEKGKAFMKE